MPFDVLFTKEAAVIALYTISGAVGVAGFLPQIWNLVVSTGKSKAISISTYTVWFTTSGIGWLYASIILQDLMAGLVAAGFTVGNGLIILLTAYNRYLRFENNTTDSA